MASDGLQFDRVTFKEADAATRDNLMYDGLDALYKQGDKDHKRIESRIEVIEENQVMKKKRDTALTVGGGALGGFGAVGLSFLGAWFKTKLGM